MLLKKSVANTFDETFLSEIYTYLNFREMNCLLRKEAYFFGEKH